MLLIHVPKLTNRLGYTLNVVMRDLLRTEFATTTSEEVFTRHEGPRLCYGPQKVGGEGVPYLKSCHLLFETVIEEQSCRCFRHEGQPALFPVYGQGADLPFDPLASIFYMLSRYEEYLPHRTDEHGRFAATESLAWREGFLHTAVVDRWALMVRDVILRHYPEAQFPSRPFEFVQTVDIDAAYQYRHKGFFRSLLGIMRDAGQPSEVKRRMRVLHGKEHDPFDTFEYILDRRKEARHAPLIFFPLLGDYGIYDKPASYHDNDFRLLLQHLGDYAKMGIHCSYYATDEPARIETEIERLSDILHRTIVRNRFHFLRFRLPLSYRLLVRYGIRHDYSMGYADQCGFRCGTCSIFPFYDLGSDSELDLRIHPFAAMDTTLHTHMQLTPDEASAQLHALVDEVRATGGTFSCIFHNQNLSDDREWQGWRAVYEDLLAYTAPR